MSISTSQIENGAKNLLLNCAEINSGDRILLIGEDCDTPYFDPLLCEDVALVAKSLGATTQVILSKPVSDASLFPTEISDAMLNADKTIFFSRLGDQVRFAKTAGNSQKIMCYTLTREHLASPFASINFKPMKKLHDLICSTIRSAKTYRIETENGTSLSSELPAGKNDSHNSMTEFSLDLFPVMIFPPVSFHNLHGKIILEDFILSSSTRAYDDSVFLIKKPIEATVENSRMTRFEGDPNVIEGLKKQLERAAKITGGDPYAINSWHTGINSHTFFAGDPYEDLERWGTVSYGSPRYTHMHAAGIDPGDISLHLFDASISFDDTLYWDKGKFIWLDRPEVRALFTDTEQKLLNPSILRNIGM